MHSKIKIAASILGADLGCLREEVCLAERAGADLIHFDVMDGHFVPNLTFGPVFAGALRPHTDLPFDLHLMVDEPDDYLDLCAEMGAQIVTVHSESTIHLQRTLSRIRTLGLKAGLALNPATGIHVLDYLLQDLDLVLVMSVNPGFAGQGFLPSILPKVRLISELIAGSPKIIELAVDGGITLETAPKVLECGATMLVAATAIFKSGDYAQAIRHLRGNDPADQ